MLKSAYFSLISQPRLKPGAKKSPPRRANCLPELKRNNMKPDNGFRAVVAVSTLGGTKMIH
jgi:hypothetical protein